MRAPGLLPLLPLLPLLLLGVSSQDDAAPADPGKIAMTITNTTTTDTSKMKETKTTNSTEEKQPTSKSTTTSPTTTPKTTAGTPSGSVNSSTPTQSPTPTPVPSTHASSATTGQAATTPDNLRNSSSAPTTVLPTSQQVNSTAGASTAAATPTTPQNQAIPPALGNLGTTTSANRVVTNVSSVPAPSGGLGAANTSTHRSEPQGSQPLDHVSVTTASTGVSRSSPAPGAKDLGVPSSSPAAKQPHSSSSSPVRDLASSPSHGSTHTTVAPLDVPLPLPANKTSLTSPPGSIHKTSEAATTLTPVAEDPEQGSHDAGPTSAKPTSASQGPASAQPPPPAPGDQTVPYSPSHQHLNTSFHNEVLCKDANGAPVEVQNNWLIMDLKEAKTCAEWRTASTNISFFESLCSTGWHTFNASRDTCTVTLMPSEPRSRHWAVQVVLHLPLHSEHILEEPERKAKLEELGIGIANITSDKADKDLIINDEFSTPLIITIVTLAGSLLLIAAIYGCCHQRFSQKKDQHIHPDLPGFDDGHVALIFNQRLTEELQTMENGYHDNPTLEVMETSSEMQEKKVNLNGELGDSWIVPLDTLMKEDLEEEEDTHL